MAVDRAFIGREYPAPQTYEVGREHVRRFAGSGPIADPALGLDYSLVVHGEQSFELHRPVVAGDVLTSVQRVDDIKDVGRNELVLTVTEVTDARGEAVATLRSTLVSRGTAAPRTPAPAAGTGA